MIDRALARAHAENDWKPFGSYEGFAYRILAVDVERRTVDMLFRFDPDADCFWHRHRSTVASLVIAGEHVVRSIDEAGTVTRSARPAGSFTVSDPGELHIEGGGADGAMVYFSFRGDDDHVYDIHDDDRRLRREVSIQDFKHALDEW